MIMSAPSLTPSELSVLKYVLLNLTRVYLKAESLWILILSQQVNDCWKQIRVKRERVHHGVIKLELVFSQPTNIKVIQEVAQASQ